MPPGKTSPVLWFSSMITRILLTPPGDVAWPADELVGAAWEEPAEGGLACPPQPAASPPASAAPTSRTSPRRKDVPRSGRPAGGEPGCAAGSGDA